MADYFGLPRIVSIILLIIPFTSWVCGFITRFMDGHIVAGLIRAFLGFNIIWILDVVFTIIAGCNVDICRLIKV